MMTGLKVGTKTMLHDYFFFMQLDVAEPTLRAADVRMCAPEVLKIRRCINAIDSIIVIEDTYAILLLLLLIIHDGHGQ